MSGLKELVHGHFKIEYGVAWSPLPLLRTAGTVGLTFLSSVVGAAVNWCRTALSSEGANWSWRELGTPSQNVAI
jgi:hypothetical protein